MMNALIISFLIQNNLQLILVLDVGITIYWYLIWIQKNLTLLSNILFYPLNMLIDTKYIINIYTFLTGTSIS